MLRPRIFVTITPTVGSVLQFDFVNSVTTEESYERLTDTAKIIVPRKITMNNQNLFAGVNPLFKRKDRVKIEAGYHPNRYTIFEGYISKVGANIPVEIDCEDDMLLLKENSITYPADNTPPADAENTSLKDLVNVLVAGTGLTASLGKDIAGFKLGQLSYSRKSAAQILEDLCFRFGLYSYCIGQTLFVSFSPKPTDGKQAAFAMEDAVINSDALSAQIADSIKKKIKLVSTLPNNQVVTGTAGDASGEEEIIYCFGISDAATLNKMAEEKLKQTKYTGFKGTIVTFGEPVVHHGDKARITSKKLPERDGIYMVKSVKRSFTIKEGYRQTIELGEKVG